MLGNREQWLRDALMRVERKASDRDWEKVEYRFIGARGRVLFSLGESTWDPGSLGRLWRALNIEAPIGFPRALVSDQAQHQRLSRGLKVVAVAEIAA